jgi:hypothetical protein
MVKKGKQVCNRHAQIVDAGLELVLLLAEEFLKPLLLLAFSFALPYIVKIRVVIHDLPARGRPLLSRPEYAATCWCDDP